MAWSHVQSVANAATTTQLNTTVAATTKGNLVTIFIKTGSTSSVISSMTDNKGNTYVATPNSPVDSSGTGLRCSMYYGVQVTGGATTVTVNISSVSIRVCVDEFNPGVTLTSNTGVLDTQTSALDGGSGTTSASVSAFTPAIAGELIVSGIAFASTVTTPVAGTNYTLGVNNGNASSEYRLSGTTSETAPISWTGSSRWTEMATAFTIPSSNHNLTLLGVGS